MGFHTGMGVPLAPESGLLPDYFRMIGTKNQVMTLSHLLNDLKHP